MNRRLLYYLITSRGICDIQPGLLREEHLCMLREFPPALRFE
jgi:hypothetical protein